MTPEEQQMMLQQLMAAQQGGGQPWDAPPGGAPAPPMGQPPAAPTAPSGMPSQAGPGQQSVMDPMLQAAMEERKKKLELAKVLAGAVGKNENTGEQGPLGLSGGADHPLVGALMKMIGK